MKKNLFSSFLFLSLTITSQTTNFQWAGLLGGSAQEYMFFASTIDQSSNVFTSGTFQGPCDFDPGPGVFNINNKAADGYISKLDASGNFIWAKQLRSKNICEPWAMVTDNLSNVFVTGTYVDSLDLDPGIGNFYVNSSGAFFLKLDQNGNFQWGASFTATCGACASQGYDVGVDALGNSIATGYFTSIVDFDPGPGTYTLDAGPFSSDAYIVKLSPTGSLVWAKQLQSSAIRSTDVDASGNIIVCGEFSAITDFDPALTTFTLDASSGATFIAKFDPNGNLIWAKQFGSGPGGTTTCWDLKVSSFGDIYVGGEFQISTDLDPGPAIVTYTTNSNADYFILKLDGTGNYQWGYTSSNVSGYEYIFSLDVDASGDVYMTGCFDSAVDFDPGVGTYTLSSLGSEDVYHFKLDASGNFMWANNLGGGGYNIGLGINVDAAGSVYTVGYLNGIADFDPSPLSQTILTPVGSEDIFVQKMSQSPLGVEQNEISKKIQLFPNPNNGQFYFRSDNSGELEIFNLAGQIIFIEKIGRGVTKINSGSLSRGIYLYSLISDDGKQQKGKFIIE